MTSSPRFCSAAGLQPPRRWFALCLWLALIGLQILGVSAAPSAPRNVALEVKSAASITVDFDVPEDDGSSAITSYLLEWDTAPGIQEVQRIKTHVELGPNEVQTIKTQAERIDEVQVIRTTATNVAEVQVVTTSGASVLGGWFTLSLDMSSSGGGVYTSGYIQHDAEALAGDGGAAPRSTMEEIVSAMPNVNGPVNVVRTSDGSGGYSWTITFQGMQGDVPELQVASNMLTGTSASVSVSTQTEGNVVSGDFAVEFMGERTLNIPYDATAAQVKSFLEDLPTIGNLDVQRSAADGQRGFAWFLTFTSDMNAGNIDAITVDDDGLDGTGAAATVCVHGDMTAPCTGSSRAGNEISGNFDVQFAGYTALNIPHDASASVMKSALEALDSIGTVDVARSATDLLGGYEWTVSFLTNEGDLPMFQTISHLSGNASEVVVTETRKGTFKAIHELNVSASGTVSGTFSLGFRGVSTDPISVSPTAFLNGSGTCDDVGNQLAEELELLVTIGELTVSSASSTPGSNGECSWKITFDTNAGNVTALEIDDTLTNNANLSLAILQESTSEAISGDFAVSLNGETSAYMSHNVSARKMKSLLERLDGIDAVEVMRSDVDESGGYEWTITFVSAIGDVSPLVVDDAALQGTLAAGTVQELVKGVPPPFDSNAGLPTGTFVLTDFSDLAYTVEGLTQGVDYYFRVGASNGMGLGPFGYPSPSSGIPLDVPPSAPENITLTVVDSTTLSVSFDVPSEDGGNVPDKYKVEWDSALIEPEVQVVTLANPGASEVQRITIHTTDANETQVVRILGGSNTTVVEEQRVECDASGGSFRLVFDEQSTRAIAFDATVADVKAALEELDNVNDVNVTLTENSGVAQTTACRAFYEAGVVPIYPEMLRIRFVSVTDYEGAVPLLTTDAAELEGNRLLTVERNVTGAAPLSGSFRLMFDGYKTGSIDAATATDALIQAALESLTSVGPGGVSVETLDTGVFAVHFKGILVEGSLLSIGVDETDMRGNDATIAVCTNGDRVLPCAGLSSQGNAARGTFTLSLLGHTSAAISYNEEDTLVKAKLEALPNVGEVAVTREGPHRPGLTYAWVITFASNPGSFPTSSGQIALLEVDDSALYGTAVNATVYATVERVVAGSESLDGTFTLTYRGLDGVTATTSDLPFSVSAPALKAELEALPNVGRVDVSRTEDSDLGEIAWSVTFTGCRLKWATTASICNVGDLHPLEPNASMLTGGYNSSLPSVVVTEFTQGTGGIAALTPAPDYGYTEIYPAASGNLTTSISGLTEGLSYYVRVSAHTFCNDTCPGCCGFGLPGVSTPLSAVPSDGVPGAPPRPKLESSSANGNRCELGASR